MRNSKPDRSTIANYIIKTGDSVSNFKLVKTVMHLSELDVYKSIYKTSGTVQI